MDPFWQDAIDRGDVGALRDLLERGADVDARDRHGQTGLIRAARAGKRDIVAALVEHGANLDVTAKYGLSALMLAVVSGHEEIARLLARAGADRSLRGSGAPGFAGQTARDLAIACKLHELAAELDDRGSAQRERAEQTWELVVLDEPTRDVLRALRRVLRIKRFELERISAALPGPVRRGARVDLGPCEAQLREAGIRCELRRRQV